MSARLDVAIFADRPEAFVLAALLRQRGYSGVLYIDPESEKKRERPLRGQWSFTGLETGDVLDFLFEELGVAFDERRAFLHAEPAVGVAMLEPKPQLRSAFFTDVEEMAQEFQRCYGEANAEGLLRFWRSAIDQVDITQVARRRVILHATRDVDMHAKRPNFWQRRRLFPIEAHTPEVQAMKIPNPLRESLTLLQDGTSSRAERLLRLLYELSRKRFVAETEQDALPIIFRKRCEGGSWQVQPWTPKLQPQKSFGGWQIGEKAAKHLVLAANLSNLKRCGKGVMTRVDAWKSSREWQVRQCRWLQLPADALNPALPAYLRVGKNPASLAKGWHAIEMEASPLLGGEATRTLRIANWQVAESDSKACEEAILPFAQNHWRELESHSESVLVSESSAAPERIDSGLYYMGPRSDCMNGTINEWYSPLLLANRLCR